MFNSMQMFGALMNFIRMGGTPQNMMQQMGMQGDPQQIIQNLLSSGRVTQEQVNQCYNDALKFQNTFFHK